MKLILVSDFNVASRNIGCVLMDKYPFDRAGITFGGRETYLHDDILIVFTDKDVIDIDHLEGKFNDLNPEIIVVASSHKSGQGVPSLTCHPTGIWTEDVKFGGKPRTLAVAPALYMRACIRELAKQKELKGLKDYDVSLEVTHHGPSYNLPLLFAEVGSSEKEWNDMRACEAVADTIFKILTEDPETVPTTFFIGGSHYAPTETRRLLSSEVAIGHMCPRHFTEFLDARMLKQAIEKTIPTPAFVTVEWKSFNSAERQEIIDLLEKNKIPYKRDKEI